MVMKVEEEFLKAYDAYADAIFRHCYYRVYHREQAKDLMQLTFMKAWQYLVDGTEVQNLRALLYKIANNLVIDEARKKRSLTSLDELELTGHEPGHNPEPSIHARLDGESLLPYLDKLDPDDRTVIVMRYLDDLSPKEIAELIGCSANVVSVRLHRGMKRLRELLPSSYVFLP